jgi:transcriptional regulator with XRE-family HTH domain
MGEGKRVPATIRLREYREDRGLTQFEAAAAIQRFARARGDPVEPGLDQTALSRHENGHRRPSLYYQALFCEFYGASPIQLGFRLALPGENGHHEDVDRREFLTGAAGFMATLALPAPTRLGSSDIDRLRQSMAHLRELDDQFGSGSVYTATGRTFQRLRSHVEHASYHEATGRALRELVAQAAGDAGWLAFDADRDDDARRWWTEAMQWSRLAESVSVGTLASMALQASDQHRPREVLELTTTAQSAASATPRLKADLLAREAQGHAGQGDDARAHAVLRRARNLAERPRHDDDPAWIDLYGPAEFASHERRVALLLGDMAATEEAARAALALNDAVVFPRNHALYLTYLADALVRRRELDEGAAIARQATVAAAGLDSARVTRQLQAVTQSLAAAA